MKTLSERISKDKNGVIDVEYVREFHAVLNEEWSSIRVWDVKFVDRIKILRSILSKNAPPQRYNGIINLLFVIGYPYATSDEIKSALVRMCDNFNAKLKY